MRATSWRRRAGEAHSGERRRREASPTASVQPTDRVKPKGACWTKRLRLHNAPSDWTAGPSMMSALEQSICKYAEETTESVIRSELGLSFYSLGEAYDFYNLYSWEIGFRIWYGKTRLNVERTKSMQEILCSCRGKLEAKNSRFCRCKCPALIRLLHAADKSWYITKHCEGHNHSISLTMRERLHWPLHKHINVYC